ncbi:MAG: hypothetical protein ACHQ53_09435 [Polyangiales bacterium]
MVAVAIAGLTAAVAWGCATSTPKGITGGSASGGAGTSASPDAGPGMTGSPSAPTLSGTGASLDAGPSMVGPPTFSRVWNEVLIPKGCTGVLCHGGAQGNLAMAEMQAAYTNLVNVAAAGPLCASSGMLRVKPGDPNASLLLDKLSHAKPACGESMPIGAKLAPNCVSNSPAVCTTDAEIGLVRDWISSGAGM